MSLITDGYHLSVKQFAAVPALFDIPAIQRTSASVSRVSSFRGTDGGVDLSEGCLVTKTVKYTHQLAHWVNAVRNGDPSEVNDLIDSLYIIPYEKFKVDQPCNLAFLEAFVHTSLDLYAFVAVTASSSTLDDLITMVRSDNDRRQREIDDTGVASRRSLNFSTSSFVNPEYELVALHPEHFLPKGCPLTIYEPETTTYKNYFAASDQCFRESSDSNSCRLPSFHHNSEYRDIPSRLNVFLVIINAEIKFRRYLTMVELNPPMTPLPDDILDLMRRTVLLVRLIYWTPLPTRNSRGEKRAKSMMASNRQNPKRVAQPDPMGSIERGSSEEMNDEDSQSPSTSTGRRWRQQWLAEVDLETRRAYGSAIMSGHDRDYDPAFFEDAFPINYVPNLYSERLGVETWTHDVTCENLNENESLQV